MEFGGDFPRTGMFVHDLADATALSVGFDCSSGKYPVTNHVYQRVWTMAVYVFPVHSSVFLNEHAKDSAGF